MHLHYSLQVQIPRLTSPWGFCFNESGMVDQRAVLQISWDALLIPDATLALARLKSPQVSSGVNTVKIKEALL